MNRLLRWLGCGAAVLVLFMIVMYSVTNRFLF
jgi:hypothetical protein